MIRQAKTHLAQQDYAVREEGGVPPTHPPTHLLQPTHPPTHPPSPKQEVAKVINRLHKLCQKPDGSDDEAKATYLMEVYALEISHCTQTRNTARMQEIFPKTLKLNAAVSDPRIMGIIREEGGKLHMSQRQWSQAYSEFNEGFRAYQVNQHLFLLDPPTHLYIPAAHPTHPPTHPLQQEAGNSRAKQLLKYAALSNILANSSINPFAATEAKVYQVSKHPPTHPPTSPTHLFYPPTYPAVPRFIHPPTHPPTHPPLPL